MELPLPARTRTRAPLLARLGHRGEYLSLAEGCLWVAHAVGSNPISPTKSGNWPGGHRVVANKGRRYFKGNGPAPIPRTLTQAPPTNSRPYLRHRGGMLFRGCARSSAG